MEHGQRELWATEVSMWLWVQWRALFFFLYNDTFWQCCFKWFHNFLEMPLVKFLTEGLITYSRRWKRQYFGPVKMVLCLFWSQMQSYAASLWSAFFLGLMSYSCVKYCVVFMANPNIVRCLAAKMKEPVLCWRWQGKKWALFFVRVPESRAILRMPCNNDHSNSSVRIYGAKVWRENHLRIKLDQTFILWKVWYSGLLILVQLFVGYNDNSCFFADQSMVWSFSSNGCQTKNLMDRWYKTAAWKKSSLPNRYESYYFNSTNNCNNNMLSHYILSVKHFFFF